MRITLLSQLISVFTKNRRKEQLSQLSIFVDLTLAPSLHYQSHGISSGADALHTAAILNWIQGLNNNGSAKQPVPAIFGGNYQVLGPKCQQFSVLLINLAHIYLKL